MQDSNGNLHMMEESGDTSYREGYRSRFPCPVEYDSRKIMKALEKLAGTREPVLLSNAALLPLTPGEKGYVLGILTSLEAGRVL